MEPQGLQRVRMSRTEDFCATLSVVHGPWLPLDMRALLAALLIGLGLLIQAVGSADARSAAQADAPPAPPPPVRLATTI